MIFLEWKNNRLKMDHLIYTGPYGLPRYHLNEYRKSNPRYKSHFCKYIKCRSDHTKEFVLCPGVHPCMKTGNPGWSCGVENCPYDHYIIVN